MRGTFPDIHPLFVKMIVAAIIPLVVIMMIWMFWKAYGYFKRDTIAAQNHMITSIVILIFVCINPITSLVF